jgi:cell division septation protein DedD
MAYALGPIRPEDRHDRIFVKRRSRKVFLILLVLVAMLGISVGFLALYRVMTRPASPEDVPLLHADAQPTRHRPDNPGGVQIPGQGTMVLDGGHGESKVEQLLPPPEQPLPRPTASEDSASPMPPAAATPTAESAQIAAAPAPVPPPPAPAPAPAPTPAPAPPHIAAAPPSPPAPSIAAAPPPAAARAVEGKGYRLQLGAVRSPEAAKQEWERLKKRYTDVLGPLSFAAQRVDLGERGVFYRIQAGPVADAAKAERDCSELKRRGAGCILVRP